MTQTTPPILVAQANSNTGFSLPTNAAPAAPAPQPQPTTTATQQVPSSGLTVESGSGGSKAELIGAGLVLLVMVVAFFLRGAWANSLVAKKVAPHAANASGWWLFVLLTATLGGGLFGFMNPGFFTVVYIGVLAVLALIALVMMLLASKR